MCLDMWQIIHLERALILISIYLSKTKNIKYIEAFRKDFYGKTQKMSIDEDC